MKRFLTIGALLVIVLTTGSLYLKRPALVSNDHVKLIEIDQTSLASIRSEFKQAASQTRVILLLSPT